MNETKIALRACPICDCSQVQVLHTQYFVLPANHPLRDGYDVVACEKCGFVYADTSATQDDYDEFYARLSKYDDAKTSTGSGATSSDAARLNDTAQEIAALTRQISQQAPQESSILDVGCATGGLLHFLQKAGFENVLGLDPSPHSATFAREHYDIEILTGGFFDAPHIEPRDVVTCSHVLEHVRDLQTAARALKNWLKPHGLLYIEVPDASRYADFVVAPFQDFNTEHINHFDLKSLNDLLEKQGLNCVVSGQKTIESAPNVPYPALWGVWSAGENDRKVDRENELLFSIQQYIRVSSALLEKMDARLREQLPEDAPVIIWGTGQLTMKLLGQTRLKDAQICAFIDGNPIHHSELWNGVQVLAPDSLATLNENYQVPPPIVIASTIHQRAIRERIEKELQLPNAIVLLND